MLDRALEDLDSWLGRLPQQRLEAFLSEHKYPRLEAFLADVALGNWMPSQAAQALTAFAELRGGGHSAGHRARLALDGVAQNFHGDAVFPRQFGGGGQRLRGCGDDTGFRPRQPGIGRRNDG